MVALGHTMPPLGIRTPRRLHCRDPRLIENYVHLFHQFARPLDLFKRVKNLDKQYRNMSKTEAILEYEELDILRCQATAFAERHCRKLCTGQVAFSPELNAGRLKMKGWLLLIAKQQNRKVSSRLLSRTLKKAGIQAEAKTLELEDLQERLKEEYQHYYQIKGEAKQLRMTALVYLALALAEKGNSEKEKILKALRHREQQRSTAKTIKHLRGKIRTGSTTIVTTTNANGNKIDITNKTEMEQAILNSNKEKFSQSAHTPFYWF
jgi:hypothetical protein